MRTTRQEFAAYIGETGRAVAALVDGAQPERLGPVRRGTPAGLCVLPAGTGVGGRACVGPFVAAAR